MRGGRSEKYEGRTEDGKERRRIRKGKMSNTT